MFAAGRVLSLRTLSSIERADPNVLASDSERSLRRVYRALINCAGAYYYLSLPFVVVLVVGGTAAVVYGFMMIGRIPIRLVALLVIAAVVTILKMVQSLFIKAIAEDPGRRLEEAEARALWQLARDVAVNVSTRPVDEIRITPGTEMAVYERGSASERRRDEAHRVLILGVGLINGFEQGAFRAVLAHELGHLLMATSAHAAKGLMRPVWSRSEIRRRERNDWIFRPGEIAVIKARAQSRLDGEPISDLQ